MKHVVGIEGDWATVTYTNRLRPDAVALHVGNGVPPQWPAFFTPAAARELAAALVAAADKVEGRE